METCELLVQVKRGIRVGILTVKKRSRSAAFVSNWLTKAWKFSTVFVILTSFFWKQTKRNDSIHNTNMINNQKFYFYCLPMEKNV